MGLIEYPSARGHRYTLCVIDICRRWVEVMCLNSLTAKVTCDAQLDPFHLLLLRMFCLLPSCRELTLHFSSSHFAPLVCMVFFFLWCAVLLLKYICHISRLWLQDIFLKLGCFSFYFPVTLKISVFETHQWFISLFIFSVFGIVYNFHADISPLISCSTDQF